MDHPQQQSKSDHWEGTQKANNNTFLIHSLGQVAVIIYRILSNNQLNFSPRLLIFNDGLRNSFYRLTAQHTFTLQSPVKSEEWLSGLFELGISSYASWCTILWALGRPSWLLFTSTGRKQYTISSWWWKTLRLRTNFGKAWNKEYSIWCRGRDSQRAECGLLSLDQLFIFHQWTGLVSWDFRSRVPGQKKNEVDIVCMLAGLSVKQRSRTEVRCST